MSKQPSIPEQASQVKHPPAGSTSVTLSTWGTKNNNSNGLIDYLKRVNFGGNPGHASLEITLPADETGEELVKKYCLEIDESGRYTKNEEGEFKEPLIPFERVSQSYLNANNKVTNQDVYKIYFSWWPDNDPNGQKRTLMSNINMDNIAERPGTNVGQIAPRFTTPSPENPIPLKPLEERIARGKLSSKTVVLSTNEISHLSGLSNKEKKVIKKLRTVDTFTRRQEALALMYYKLDSNKKNMKVDETLYKLLNKRMPGWKNEVQNPKILSQAEINSLKEQIKFKVEKYEDRINKKGNESEEIIKTINESSQKKIQMEITEIEQTIRNSLDPRELKDLPIEEKKEKIKQPDGSDFSAQAWAIYEINSLDEDYKNAKKIVESISEAPVLNNMMKMMLFDLYEHDEEVFPGWKKFLPEEYKNVTKEEMNEDILNQVKEKAEKRIDETQVLKEEKTNEYLQLTRLTSSLEKGGFEQNVTKGHAPTHQVALPVGGIKENQQFKGGLNIEQMLIKMNELASSNQAFDLKNNNCSLTVGAILAAGAEPEHKSNFDKKLFGKYGTPQAVLNHSLKYQKEIIKNSVKVFNTHLDDQNKEKSHEKKEPAEKSDRNLDSFSDNLANVAPSKEMEKTFDLPPLPNTEVKPKIFDLNEVAKAPLPPPIAFSYGDEQPPDNGRINGSQPKKSETDSVNNAANNASLPKTGKTSSSSSPPITFSYARTKPSAGFKTNLSHSEELKPEENTTKQKGKMGIR